MKITSILKIFAILALSTSTSFLVSCGKDEDPKPWWEIEEEEKPGDNTDPENPENPENPHNPESLESPALPLQNSPKNPAIISLAFSSQYRCFALILWLFGILSLSLQNLFPPAFHLYSAPRGNFL